MIEFLIRLLGGFPASERNIISKVSWDAGWQYGYKSGQDSTVLGKDAHKAAWKEGYRFAQNTQGLDSAELDAMRAEEDAEVAELAMMMAQVAS